ncbi:MAG: hypothetical protein P4L84_33010 [Isosphaeraceae bacterium]|nr:hypothetical protein [Isosphaeraceae bacterium]
MTVTTTMMTRRPLLTPKARTRKAWLAFRRAEMAWREACDRYAAEMRGIPPADRRTDRHDRIMSIWESLTDELCAKAAQAREAVRRAIRIQRMAEIREQLRCQV